MKAVRPFPVAVLLAVVASACGGTSSTTIAGPSPVKCGVQAAASPTSFAPEGGRGTITIETTRDCSWTAAVEAGWVALDGPSQGQGSASVPYIVSANPAPSARTGTIRVDDRSLQITQEPAPCRYELDRPADTIGAEGGELTVRVSTLTGCSWTAHSTADWVAVADGAQGGGTGTVRFHVSANTGAERTAGLTVADLPFALTQSSASSGPPPAPSPPPAPPTCTVTIAPESRTIDAGGGDGTVSVTAGATCDWTASSNAAWITIASGGSGSGNGQVRYSVAPHTGTSSRTGTVTIAGRTHTVTQPAPPMPPPACTFAIAPESRTMDADGGDGTVSVTAGATCDWTASSDAEWITIVSGADGRGNGQVRYTVTANPGTSGRTGTVTIARRTHTVTQPAAPAPPAPPPTCTFTIAPESHAMDASGGDGTVTVTAGATCDWTASSQAPWITVTSGASGRGNGQVRYTVAPNSSSMPREGTLLVAGLSHTVRQAPADDDELETVEGPVSRISGTCPNLTFFVRNVEVATNAATRWTAGACSDLRNNSRVEVRGRRSGDTLHAASVESAR
jgi:hypothetical protein